MKEKITKATQQLVGLPLWSIGRAGDLEWFCFGENRQEMPSRHGQSKIVSDYALHLTCSWMITKDKHVFVASGDLYFPKGDDPFIDYDDFDWDTPAGNRMDEKIAILDEQFNKKPIIVLSVEVDEVGGMNISFTDDYSLKVFPNTSFSEYWRLFMPYDESEHFVVTAQGIEES